jgi:hypothetical protein
MGASGTPILKSQAVTSVGQTMSFGQAVQGVVLKNLGPDTAFFAFGIVAPTATLGNGRYGLKVGESIAIPNVSEMSVSFATAAGKTATIQCAGVPVGSIDFEKDTTHAVISLTALGVNAITAGVTKIAGPVSANIPLNAYDEIAWDRANAALADFMSIAQGATNVSCNMLVDIEVELDGSTVYTRVFRFRMNVTGSSGGSGSAGVSIAQQQAKENTVAALKAIGGTITNFQARILLTKTAGTGTPTGAVAFANAQMILLKGVLGATYS